MERWQAGSGPVVATRFELEGLMRHGSRGELFRAHDRQTGQTVALKRLQLSGGAEDLAYRAKVMERFAGLRLPGMAPHVAHGPLAPQEFFVATEWLTGMDLGRRLAHRPLCLAESIALVRAVATTLAAVHAQGLMHGALKPSRLFLRGGAAEDVVVLGFGWPHGNLSARTITRSDELVATLRYVAPELVRGTATPVPATDIFALGCVLFECLTGVPPFAGEHAGLVLAQLLCGESPSLARVRPELLGPLQALLARMLAPSLAERMAHGGELVAALASIEVPSSLGKTLPMGLAPPLFTGEAQRLVHLILGLPPGTGAEAARAVGVTPREGPQTGLEQELAAFGARIDVLADGSLLVSLGAEDAVRHTATDQAMQAARTAQRLQERWPAWQVAVTTVRKASAASHILGQALHQAAILLDDAAAHVGTVWLDELTAELLDTRFQVHPATPGRWALGEERRGPEENRLLLGRPTPCVGREQELGLLSSMVLAAIEEEQARVALVLGSAGIGKSRLRHELVQRLREEHSQLKVAVARGDALHAGIPNALLGQAILGLAGLPTAGALEERQALLEEQARQRVPPEDVARVTEFLGELCGLPFADEARPQLRAARQDPRLLNEQETAAFLAFLGAECAAHPVLLVFEDLHWSDDATVRRVEPPQMDALLDALARGGDGRLPSVRTLLLFGDADRFPPSNPRAARKLQARIPGAQLALVPGAGHLPQLENPDAFVTALMPFVL